MITKNIFLAMILFIAFSFNKSFAQWSFGIQGGLNISKYSLTNLGYGSTLSNKNGLTLGGEVIYKLNDNLGFLSGLRYDQKGGKVAHNYSNFSGNASVFFNYLEVPIQIIYMPFDFEINPVLLAGVDISYIVLSKTEGIINNQKVVEDNTDQIDNRLDLFLDTGIGIMPNITDKISYLLTVGYYYGLSDLDEYITNSGVHFLIGLNFKL